MVDKLEACPFCAGKGHLQFSEFEISEGWHVVCHGKKDCPLYCSEPYRAFDTEAEAIAAWNTRATPTEDARSRVKVLEEARPFSEWHEDHGDVLWWKLPIMESPYCGSPLDLGRGMKVTVQIGFEEHEMPIANTGGWPFTEEDEPDLWWTPLPSPTFFRTALGNKETDRHG